MLMSSAMVANIYTGFDAMAWTAWLFFAVFIGLIILWLFAVRWLLMILSVD
jgi:phospholipid-translocating ATPase